VAGSEANLWYLVMVSFVIGWTMALATGILVGVHKLARIADAWLNLSEQRREGVVDSGSSSCVT